MFYLSVKDLKNWPKTYNSEVFSLDKLQKSPFKFGSSFNFLHLVDCFSLLSTYFCAAWQNIIYRGRLRTYNLLNFEILFFHYLLNCQVKIASEQVEWFVNSQSGTNLSTTKGWGRNIRSWRVKSPRESCYRTTVHLHFTSQLYPSRCGGKRYLIGSAMVMPPSRKLAKHGMFSFSL